MKCLHLLVVAIFAFVICFTFTEAAPSFGLEKLFGDLTGYNSGYNSGYNDNRQYNSNPTRTASWNSKPKGRTYAEICRQVNPAPYALPNKLPFPSVPVC